MNASLFIPLAWIVIGVTIGFCKIKQNRKFIGFYTGTNFLVFVVLVLFWPITLFYFYRSKKTYKDLYGYGISKINDYFVNAAQVWIYCKDKKAEIAALAAAKVAKKQERASMLDYLKKNSDIGVQPKINRWLKLYEKIASREWDSVEAAEEKQRLYEIDRDLFEALEKEDASVFIRLHPTFFKGWPRSNPKLGVRHVR